MYIKVDLNKPVAISAGSGSGKNTIVVVDAEDVLSYPARDSKGIKISGNMVLKNGARMVRLYTTKSKTNAPVESDGEEDSINIKQSIDFQHPGNSLAVKEFIQNWLGRDVYVFHGSCADDFLELMGTPCAPLQLKPSKTDGNDARFWMLKFEAFANSQYLPGHYLGELVFTGPTVVTDATEVAIDTAVNSQYKLPSSDTATDIAFSVVVANHGDVVSLIGQGGTTPATLSQDVESNIVVLLKEATTWTALNDSVINLEVFKSGTITVLLETSRA